MPNLINRRITLASRPDGYPTADNFKLVEAPVPDIGPGQVLVRALYLSLDPYMRGRMSAAKSYAPPVEIGATMVGGIVGKVIASEHKKFAVGEIVEGRLGWQDYGISDGRDLRKVDPSLGPLSTAVGVLGIAGDPRKIAWITRELGFDAGIDYKNDDLDLALTQACPDGVDAYFDNVGGPVSEAVFRHLGYRPRIAICGQMSQYNVETPAPGARNLRFMLVHRARMEGFLVSDFTDRWNEGLKRLSRWVRDGKIKYREDMVEGLENAPDGFMRLMRGENFGKLVVKIADE